MRRLSARLLALVAERLAETRPIERVPGWWSGMALAPPMPAMATVRRRLWEALPGARVRVPWYDDLRVEVVLGNDLSRCLYVGGAIDPNEFAFLADVLRPGMTVVDVGANEGLYSLFASRRVGAGGTVIAVEPSPREIARLRRNVALNAADNVRIHEVALADRDAEGILHVAEGAHAGHNTLGRFVAPHVRGAGDEVVPLVRLDTLLAREGVTRVDLVKIDVEGGELAVLRGAEATLRRWRPLLLLELTEETLATHAATTRAVTALLASSGYALCDFSPDTGALRPLPPEGPASVNVVARAY